MRVVTSLADAGGIALALAIALGGCSKVQQIDPRDVGKARVQAKRQQTACASPAAYGRLKGVLFDQAISAHSAHSANRSNLDTLADYSSARMDDPVVQGWDPALDVTRCRGHFTLEFPPGAERAFAGKRRLEADMEYTAQAAADGNGFVYQVKGESRSSPNWLLSTWLVRHIAPRRPSTIGQLNHRHWNPLRLTAPMHPTPRAVQPPPKVCPLSNKGQCFVLRAQGLVFQARQHWLGSLLIGPFWRQVSNRTFPVRVRRAKPRSAHSIMRLGQGMG